MATDGTTSKIATAGEIFADGAAIELVQVEAGSGQLQLLLWNGTKSEIGLDVEYGGAIYVPSSIDASYLRALVLPARRSSPEPARRLLTDIAGVISNYTGLNENFVTAIGTFAMSTWVVRSLPMAPWLAVVGPESKAARQLRHLLRCLCRHALALTDVTLNGLCSLPPGWDFTFLINQAELRPQVERFLSAARNRDDNILRNGRLHRLYAPVATFAEVYPKFSGSLANLEIPVIPTDGRLSLLDENSANQIADEFQARLLGYFLDYGQAVKNSTEDAATLNYSVREIARSMVATTPDDPDLQKKIMQILEMQHVAMRPQKVDSIDGALIEAVLFHCHEGQKDRVYVGEITVQAQTILLGRGETTRLTSRGVGEKLRQLQFRMEPRDSRGFGLTLTREVCHHAHELGRIFDVPTLQDTLPSCKYCGSGSDREAYRKNTRVVFG